MCYRGHKLSYYNISMEEYVDVLDDKGNPTGKQELKSTAHKLATGTKLCTYGL